MVKKDKDSSTLTAEIIDDFNKRDFYLSVLDDTINNLHYKATKGRIRDAKNEKVKIDTFRALIYAINTANSVFKDKQIDKLESDIDMLKKGLVNKTYDDNNISGELTDDELNEIFDFDERISKLRNNNNDGGDS